MKALALSGGGAKGAFTAGVVYYMEDDLGMSFDLAVGTSTGSLVGGPALLDDVQYLRNTYTGVANASILKNSYLGQFLRILLGENIPIQASMDPLHNLLTKYYFDHPEGPRIPELQRRHKTLVVTSVNARTGAIAHVSSDAVITDVNPNPPQGIKPETFIRAIVASASMPIFTKGVKVFELEPNHPERNDLFWDGGVKEFIPVSEAVRLKADTVYAVPTHIIRPHGALWAGTTDPDKANLLKVLKWVIDSALNEVEIGDMFRAYAYLRVGEAREKIRTKALDAGVDAATAAQLAAIVDAVFPSLEDHLTKLYVIPPLEDIKGESLEFKDEEMNTLFQIGRKAARKFFEQPEPQQLFAEAGASAMGLG